MLICEVVPSQPTMVSSVCVICDERFSYVPLGPRPRRVCSDQCYRVRHNAYSKSYREDGRYLEKSREYERPKRSALCVICGEVFHTPNSRTITCGKVCGARKVAQSLKDRGRIWPTVADRERYFSYRRRAVIKSAVAEIFPASEIFERGGWRCQICRKKVSRSSKWPHPKSPSLDHIIPISKGGKHIRSNVQCVHFTCNSKKGNRGADQLLLFG